MKLALRIFACAVVIAGAAAATRPATMHSYVSHQAVSSAMPIPGCGPTMGCMPPVSGK